MCKKNSLLIMALIVVAVVFGACAPQAAATVVENPETGVIYFENGTIYTVDDQDTIAEALAIEDGVIVFVGAAEDGKTYREAAEEVVDLKGGMLLPGFIDAHIHSVMPEFFDFTLLDDFDVDSVLDTIEKYIKANPDQESYSGFGYYAWIFEGEELLNGPQKERLDEICPDKPIFIYSYDGHAAWLNSKCFEVSGITEETQSTPGGEIVKDSDTGALWGTLRDTAMSMLPPVDISGGGDGSSLAGVSIGAERPGVHVDHDVAGQWVFPRSVGRICCAGRKRPADIARARRGDGDQLANGGRHRVARRAAGAV